MLPRPWLLAVWIYLLGVKLFSSCLRLFPISLSLCRGGALLTSPSGPGYHIMLPFVTTFKSVQVGTSSSWQRVGLGADVGGDIAGWGWLLFAEGLGDVIVRAAAPAKPLVPSALGGSPSCVLGLVLLVASAQRACVLLGTGDVLLWEDSLCLWP